MDKYLAIDVGGTNIKYALMTEKAEILESGLRPTLLKQGLEGFLRKIEDIYRLYADQAQGIALSLPGIIDSEKGYCHTGGALTFLNGQSISKHISERCGVPVHIENDGKCAALAELRDGALKGCQNALVYIMGSGIGGGIIINGELVKGKHFYAGELSYVCTNETAWEDGGYSQASRCAAVPMIQRIKAEKGITEDSFDGIKAFELIVGGDRDALRIFHETTRAVAIQLFNLQMILDLEKIAIGGGISRQPILIEGIRNSIDEICETYPGKEYNPNLPKPIIVPCRFLSDANLIGALYNYLKSEGKLN